MVINQYKFESESLMSCLQIGKMLTSTLNYGEILKLAMSKVSELIPAKNWSLLLVDEEAGELKFEIAVGIDIDKIKDIRIPIGKGIAGTVAQSGEPVIVEDALSDPQIDRRVDKITGFRTESIVGIPLKSHGKILGVIEVVNLEDPKRFREHELPVLNIIADYAAIAIENADYFSRIEKMSITDEYTGLYNARYLHSCLESLIKKADENSEKISVIFVDMDNFKSVVDRYGHLAGSKVLGEVAVTMRSCVGNNDILIKYGGDEYVIILPGRDKEPAKALARKVLEEIRNTKYLRSELLPVKVTASFGIAVYPDDAETKKDLLIVADDLMYGAKEDGKNGIKTT